MLVPLRRYLCVNNPSNWIKRSKSRNLYSVETLQLFFTKKSLARSFLRFHFHPPRCFRKREGKIKTGSLREEGGGVADY